MASRRLLPAAVLLLLVAGLEEAGFVAKARVSVVFPEHIRGRHDAAIANFGVPNYGASMVGAVVYPDSSPDTCLAFDRRFKSSHSSLPAVLLLDRGECYFAKKVWHGQEAGAAAVLVADNVDEPLITMQKIGKSNSVEGHMCSIQGVY